MAARDLASPVRALPSIAWLDELTAAEVSVAGGKGANLGELVRAGFQVPDGFVVTTNAYQAAMEESGVRDTLRARSAAISPGDERETAKYAGALQALVIDAGLPEALRNEVSRAYHRFGGELFVAVRSSGLAEDARTTSFAGMHETFTNVRGEDELLARILDCWASLFSVRACAYRASQGVGGEPAIAVIVQRMVNADRSGVMFTADPTTGDRSRLVIEAAYGQGEVVVEGQVEPDTYTVAKDDLTVLSTRIGKKSFAVVRGTSGHDRRVECDPATAQHRVLEHHEVVELVRLGVQVEDHYGIPQDIEWVMEGDVPYIVQTRPVTTLDRLPSPSPSAVSSALVDGLPATPGVVRGSVRLLRSPQEGAKFQDGDVLVAATTSPDWMPIMRRASAIVTDSGGVTSHAAILSRELGVPCIVGTGDATQRLRDGMLVTVDAERGIVFEG
jgi:pyruvate,water dikinase